MIFQRIVGALIAALLASLASAQTTTGTKAAPLASSSASMLSDAEIRGLLVDRIDVQHKSVGMVVGIITPQGRRIVPYGPVNQGDPHPLDGETVFEIGSVTKIFTALLLADMVQHGEVALNDPVAKYLPDGVKVPEQNGRKITLADLATHTSGLPFFPSDIPLQDPAEAGRIVAKYSIPNLYQFLSTYELPQDIGSKWAYSNLGFGLLGQALARRAGMDYEALVRLRITGPLGMESTAITLSPQMRARLGVGHDAKLQPAPEVDMPAFIAAGSLRSTTNDLLTFLAAFMGYCKSPLAPAMAAMLGTRRPGPGLDQALGWWIVKLGPADDGFVAFGGQTLGYAATVAYDPKTSLGVVVLSNSTLDDGGLGWHLLRPTFPVATSAIEKAHEERARSEVPLDPKLMDTYAGQYRVASGPTMGDLVTLQRQGDGLVLKSSTTPPEGVRLHAKSERSFFLTEADIQIDIETDSQGRATGLVFHFAGTETAAPRIDVTGEKP
jgi:CubicO group peptidase (beta-lactamase class C family)